MLNISDLPSSRKTSLLSADQQRKMARVKAKKAENAASSSAKESEEQRASHGLGRKMIMKSGIIKNSDAIVSENPARSSRAETKSNGLSSPPVGSPPSPAVVAIPTANTALHCAAPSNGPSSDPRVTSHDPADPNDIRHASRRMRSKDKLGLEKKTRWRRRLAATETAPNNGVTTLTSSQAAATTTTTTTTTTNVAPTRNGTPMRSRVVLSAAQLADNREIGRNNRGT